MIRNIILLFILLMVIISCDIREPQPYIIIDSVVKHVYVADSTIVTIGLRYSNDSVANQRIYITSDNGLIGNNIGQYTEEGDTLFVNTNVYGNAFILYTNPKYVGTAKLDAWSYIDEGIKLQNSLIIEVRDMYGKQ